MKNKENKYFRVSIEKEFNDTQKLIKLIKEDEWFKPSTILVNCSPDYSSRLTQSINHGLSFTNRNELLEQMDLAMPYPNSSQVWNPSTKSYDIYDTYLKNWINENVYPCNFLFIDSGVLRGRNFNKLKLSLRNKLENENFRFASLYVQDDSILIPDFFIEKFNKQEHGGLLFDWENPLNPNWDY